MNRLSVTWRVIRQNGGLWGSLKALGIRDDLKEGRFIGEDEYGNKYYENNKYFFGRNRWVNYADHVGLNYDASQVPAEWFGWLHYRTDEPPYNEPFRPKYNWMMRHEENMSGTSKEYVPYTTTPPKIHAWRPPKLTSGLKLTSGDTPGGRTCPPPLRDKQTTNDDLKLKSSCEKPVKAFH